ncbi:hypothetical protein Dcar01_03838 [Deinococcus carri]|uniref:VRR-NUC domain-containing protein n=1 Tax=Deinococcus carri TaxID=1211323 RepID=A0ABP9WCL9_9DEIO
MPSAPAALPSGGLPRSASNGYASEAAFQADAVRELEARGWTVWQMFLGSTRGGSIWATKGIPDLLAFRAPRTLLWLELKQPGNRPSEAQLERHAELRAAGFRIAVVWTLTDLLSVADEERIACP